MTKLAVKREKKESSTPETEDDLPTPSNKGRKGPRTEPASRWTDEDWKTLRRLKEQGFP
jgi:hypothetical protein